MRCNNCNKFVGQDGGEPEITSDPELNETGVIIEVRVPVTCQECGDELKEGSFQLEGEFPQEIIDAHIGDGHELEVEADSPDLIDDYQTKDRRGKPIKNPRYQTHLYGATVNVSLRCSCQAKDAEPLAMIDLSDTMPASSMDELQ
jgi:hypothetical protein